MGYFMGYFYKEIKEVTMLTELQCKNFQPQSKSYKKFDGGGMFLLIKPNGNKYWHLKYKYAGKEKLLSLGVYPRVSLKEARKKRDELKIKISEHVDPTQERKKIKQKVKEDNSNTFKCIAMEWYHHKRGTNLNSKDAKLELSRLERHVIPYIGEIPIRNVTAVDIIKISRIMENNNVLSEAKKTRCIMNQIYKYAIITKKAEHNLVYETQGAYKLPKENHYPSFTEKEFREFLQNFDKFSVKPITKLALKFLILTFLRSGAIRLAHWEEFDFEKKEWRIPADHMKMKRFHIVPLSKQALEVLDEARKYSNNVRPDDLVFPSVTNPAKEMSDSTLSKALRDRGYQGKATPHGMRATASTILNEKGFPPDVIEIQLAHIEKNKVRASYNHAQYLQKRREMMDWWGNYVQKYLSLSY
jgi:integrase